MSIYLSANRGLPNVFRTLSSTFLLSFCIFGSPHNAPAFAQAATPSALLPLPHPATPDQIRQYLQLSGELNAYRDRWIAAVDKNRSIGAPYWPEAFWTEVKARMKRADLMPLYLAWYQHTVSTELMKQVIDSYQTLGANHFQGSPACFKLGEAQQPYQSEMDKLTLTNTSIVINQIYAIYKPQIKAARVKYMAEHPDWKDN